MPRRTTRQAEQAAAIEAAANQFVRPRPVTPTAQGRTSPLFGSAGGVLDFSLADDDTCEGLDIAFMNDHSPGLSLSGSMGTSTSLPLRGSLVSLQTTTATTVPPLAVSTSRAQSAASMPTAVSAPAPVPVSTTVSAPAPVPIPTTVPVPTTVSAPAPAAVSAPDTVPPVPASAPAPVPASAPASAPAPAPAPEAIPPAPVSTLTSTHGPAPVVPPAQAFSIFPDAPTVATQGAPVLLDIPKSRRSRPAAVPSLPPPPPLWTTATTATTVTTDPAAAAMMSRASRSAAMTPVGASSRIGVILPTLLTNRAEAAQKMKAQLQEINEEWEEQFAKQSQWHREEVARMATQLEAARNQAAEHIAALTAENNNLREEVRRVRAAARMAGIDCSIMVQEKKALQEAMGEDVIERIKDGQRAALEREMLRAEKEHWADASEMRAKVARLHGEEAARTKMTGIVEQVLAEQATLHQAMADELVAARQRAAEAQHQRQLAEAKFTEFETLARVRATELAKVAEEKEALAIAMATQTEAERSNATKLKVETRKCEQLRASQAAAYEDLLHAQKAHREATESAKAAAKAEMEAALARYKDTKAKHHAVKGTCAKLKRELATAHEEKERVEAELSALETRYAQQEEELQQQAKRVAAQAKQLETFKSTLKDAKARTEAARSAMATLREKTGEDESTTSRVRTHPPSSPSTQPSERKKRRRSQPRSAQRVQEAAA